jgi:hypothetical protein
VLLESFAMFNFRVAGKSSSKKKWRGSAPENFERVFSLHFSRYILSVSVLVAEEKDGSADVGVGK